MTHPNDPYRPQQPDLTGAQQPAWPGAYPPPQYPGYPPPRPSNGLALAAMITSICSLMMCQPVGIVGAIMGHKARKQLRERNEEGEGFATAGIIVGWVGFGIGLVAILAVVAWVIFLFVLASQGEFDTTNNSSSD